MFWPNAMQIGGICLENESEPEDSYGDCSHSKIGSQLAVHRNFAWDAGHRASCFFNKARLIPVPGSAVSKGRRSQNSQAGSADVEQKGRRSGQRRRTSADHQRRAITRMTCVANQIPVPRGMPRSLRPAASSAGRLQLGDRRCQIDSASFGALRDGFRGCLTHGLGHRGAAVATELDARRFAAASAAFVRSEITFASCSATAARM